MEFSELHLHDCSIERIQFEWETSECSISIDGYRGKTLLRFLGVSNLVVPKMESWGPSDAINEVRNKTDRVYELEIQSGDVIVINATSWSVEFENNQNSN